MASKAKKQNFVKDALVLCIITLVAGALLGLSYEVTKGPIKKAEDAAKTAAYRAVYAEADSFASDDSVTAMVTSGAYTSALAAAGVEKASVLEAFQALDASGNVIGYVMTTESTGAYNGQLTISVGLTTEGKVVGMSYLVLAETSGIGSKAADPEFMNQYIGAETELFELGQNVDAMTGATVTSKAVTNAMNAALVFVQQLAQ